MAIKRLKSRRVIPIGVRLNGIIGCEPTSGAPNLNFLFRFFTPNTTTEIGRAMVPGTKVICHVADDTANATTSARATDLATAITLANEMKADFNAHIASTTFHTAADTTNAVTSANATDQATLNTLLNEMKADFNAHRQTASGNHSFLDMAHVTISADATTLATSLTLVNEMADTSAVANGNDYNSHRIAIAWKFTLAGILPGTYDIGIKSDQTISMLCEDVVIAKGVATRVGLQGHTSVVAQLGGMWQGDLDGNDTITIVDVTTPNNAFGKGGGCNGAGYGGATKWLSEEYTAFGIWTMLPTARRKEY